MGSEMCIRDRSNEPTRDNSFSISTSLPLINLSGELVSVSLVSLSILINQRVGIFFSLPMDAFSRLSMNQILESRFVFSFAVLVCLKSLMVRGSCLILLKKYFGELRVPRIGKIIGRLGRALFFFSATWTVFGVFFGS